MANASVSPNQERMSHALYGARRLELSQKTSLETSRGRNVRFGVMRLRFAKILLCAVAVFGASGACSKKNNVDQSKETTNNVFEKTIDEDGGPVGDRNSSGAFLPANAVDVPQDIVIRTADEDEYPTLPENATGSVYSFEPHGLEFNTPVDVYLPLPEGRREEEFTVWHASVDGTWEDLNREKSPSKTSVRAQTLSFSYFVLVDVSRSIEKPNGGAGAGVAVGPGGGSSMGGTSSTGDGGRQPVEPTEPMAGKPGTGGTDGAGGVPGSGGVPGGGGGLACEIDDTADTGSCEASGQVAGMTGPVSFPAVDGFAVVSEQMPPQVTLVFTSYPMACGAALGMNGSKAQQDHMPTGLANSELMTVYLELDDTQGEIAVVTGQYPRAQKADRVDMIYFETDTSCKAIVMRPQGAPSSKLSITEFDAVHVAGTIDFMAPGTSVPFTATFDFPVCPLQQAAGAPCCAE
jgi:hypothetical protein